MALADDLKDVVFEGRGISGELGFRPYRAYIVQRRYDGEHIGDGDKSETDTDLLEGSSQPPKVRWPKGEERAVGGLADGTVIVGPITPEFSGGGTPLDTISAWQMNKDLVYLKIVGPQYEQGALYRISDINTEKPLRYMIMGEPVVKEELG
jgi:hypothetical protein